MHQKAYTSLGTKLSHQGADNRSKKNYYHVAGRKETINKKLDKRIQNKQTKLS